MSRAQPHAALTHVIWGGKGLTFYSSFLSIAWVLTWVRGSLSAPGPGTGLEKHQSAKHSRYRRPGYLFSAH